MVLFVFFYYCYYYRCCLETTLMLVSVFAAFEQYVTKYSLLKPSKQRV